MRFYRVAFFVGTTFIAITGIFPSPALEFGLLPKTARSRNASGRIER